MLLPNQKFLFFVDFCCCFEVYKEVKFSKRKEKLGRYAKHSSYYKSSSTRCPAAPTTQLDTPPPPPPTDLATRYSKRKISKADLAADLTSSLKRRTQSETKLLQEIAARDTLLQKQYRQQELRAKERTKCDIISGILMESRKAGRKCTADLKVSEKKREWSCFSNSWRAMS